MDKKNIAALIVTGAMVLGLSACGTNGAASDNAGNSQSTSAPVVTEPADTSKPEPVSTTEPSEQEIPEPEDTQEPGEEQLGIELPPVEVFYVRDYDKDNNGTISKDEWEQWCADHPEDKNKNMHIEDSEKPKPQTPTVDTSGNPSPGSEQTSKPTTNPEKPNTSTEKPNTNTEKPSTNTEKPNTEKPNTGNTTQTTPPPSEESVGGSSNPGGGLTEQEQANGAAFDQNVIDSGGTFSPSGWGSGFHN